MTPSQRKEPIQNERDTLWGDSSCQLHDDQLLYRRPQAILVVIAVESLRGTCQSAEQAIGDDRARAPSSIPQEFGESKIRQIECREQVRHAVPARILSGQD